MQNTRRALLVGLAAGATGCLGPLGTSGRAGSTTTLEPGAHASPDGFADEARALRERYGDAGVWGLAEGPSVGPGVAYLGAWRDSLAVGPEGDRFVSGDAAALLYRLDGGERYRLWLWAAVRAHQREGRFGRANATRVAVAGEAGEGWALTDYAPRGASRSGPVPVSLDERGPSARTSLPGGGIGPVNESTRPGPEGRATVAWRGIAPEVRSVNAVCAFTPVEGADVPFSVTVSASVSGGRGVL